MELSPKTKPYAALTSLINIGAFVSGIYQGVAHANGSPIDPNVKTAIQYGPIALNFIVGIPLGKKMSIDDNVSKYLQTKNPQATSKDLEAMSGCLPTIMPVMNAGFTVGIEYVGYLIGNFIGNQAR